jgi:hypothetical protein
VQSPARRKLPILREILADQCERQLKAEVSASGWCPECWVMWARALRPGQCVCTGGVKLGRYVPSST